MFMYVIMKMQFENFHIVQTQNTINIKICNQSDHILKVLFAQQFATFYKLIKFLLSKDY